MRHQSTDQYTDRYTDQYSESVSVVLRTDGRDGLTNKSLEDMRKSFTSVPHARIPNDHEMAAGTAALRASHPRTTPDAATEENR